MDRGGTHLARHQHGGAQALTGGQAPTGGAQPWWV